jgi:hypothetical protein
VGAVEEDVVVDAVEGLLDIQEQHGDLQSVPGRLAA